MSRLGTLFFGVIGLIGNLISFLVIYRFSFAPHSFVEYLRVISLFDFLTLLYELVQALNKLCIYLFAVNLLNLRFSLVCKLYDYFKYSIIILSCWSIAALSIDRFILVCRPFASRWPNLSHRICNATSARRIILTLICSSLLLNIPHLIWKEWTCREAGFQHSAPFALRSSRNQSGSFRNEQSCSCRVAPRTSDKHVAFFLIWSNYVIHMTLYTLLPAVILIASNAGLSSPACPLRESCTRSCPSSHSQASAQASKRRQPSERTSSFETDRDLIVGLAHLLLVLHATCNGSDPHVLRRTLLSFPLRYSPYPTIAHTQALD